MAANIQVTELAIYPVKSTRQIVVSEAIVGSIGFTHDRCWMLIDANGDFITQRKHTRLVLVTTMPTPGGLQVSAIGYPTIDIPTPGPGSNYISTKVWQDNCEGLDAGNSAAEWFSLFLGLGCRLLYMPGTRLRALDSSYSQPGDRTSFADGFPFLLTSTGSLDELNSRLGEPVTMNRFRPSIVINAQEPFIEDQWQKLRIGEVVFRVAKACSRCAMTTVDPVTAQNGKEPLRTLFGYRRTAKGVLFGQNLAHETKGKIRVGDSVEILA